ncbi:hypothetical protein C8R43DRAFT_2958 [Mycena crocata]|nr:hypothetical protein C8R43DRAFT_2958 [Mycena crocata]
MNLECVFIKWNQLESTRVLLGTYRRILCFSFRFFAMRLTKVYSGAVIKYLDELERSPDEAFENEPHGIDINLLEVFPSPETVGVLRWLLFSAERLHWTQLADAIAFQGWGRNIYDPSLRNSNTDDIVLCLKSFLAQNHVLSTSLDNSGTPPNAFVVRSRNRPPPIVFAPSPAQQRTTIPPFNHTYDLNPGSSHRFIAIRSIRYLLHFTDHPLDSTTLHKYPLAVYASKYWCHHLLHCDDPTDLLEDAMCLLDDDSGPFIALNHLRTGGSRGKIDWYLPPVSPLCVCSEEGYADGVRALLERGARVDGDYNALLAALRGGHIEIEELLLANGGDLSKERSKLGFSRSSLIRIQILVVQDIDGKSIYLLRKDCMSWEFFFRCLVEQEPQALQYIVNNQTVVRLKEGWKQLNSHNWEEWIFSVLGSRQPEIMLCMIRRDTCCAQSTEDKNGRCVNCGTQFVEDEPENWVPDALTFISAQDKTSSSTPGPKNGAAHDNNSSNRTTPMSPSADITVSASATPPESSESLLTADVSVLSSSVESTVAGPEAETVTTSISFAPSNSVMSRRRPKDLLYPPPSQDTAEQLRMEALPPKRLSLRRITTLYLGQWFAQVINCVRTVYVFMIAPPFLRINGEWNAQRLENRLKAFETWVWAANAALLAVAAAFLTLSTVASSTIPQSFLILSGIFSLFGFMYTVSLAFHMGDCKTDFAHWFHRHRNWRHTSRSLWNLSIMLSLPLTWMAWAFVNLGFFVISIGVQNLMLDVRENHSHGGQLPGATTLDIVDTPDPSFTSFAILQLVLFTVASVWSCIYAFKIYIEIDNYGKCLRPKRQHSSLVERGIEQDVSVGRT